MFTGIIEEIGIVENVRSRDKGAYISITCKKILEGTNLGDSISINGACQTVTEISKSSVTVFCSYETLRITTLKLLKIGDKINLERALRLNDRLGGHIVTGHIDGTGKLLASEKIGEAHKMSFSADEELIVQIVKKGSITINGVSLTVADLTDSSFSTAVIPLTFENTVLQDLKIGSEVNIETDILGKYVEKFLFTKDNRNTRSAINADFLERNGFI